MRKSALKIRVLAGVLAVVYAAIVLIVWTVQTRAAADRLDGMMGPSVSCAVDTVDWAIEPEVLHVARVLVGKWKSADAVARADLKSVQAYLDCDQINIVGTNDVVIASTDPASVGFDMTSEPETDEFAALNRGEIAFKTKKFHRSLGCRPGGDEGMWFKYAGLPFPGGRLCPGREHVPRLPQAVFRRVRAPGRGDERRSGRLLPAGRPRGRDGRLGIQ